MARPMSAVAHVVGRAGVSRRTFYEIFRDRDDCFLAAFDEGVARATRYVLDEYDPASSWVERVRAALIGLLAFLDAERLLGHLLLVGSLGAGPDVLERRRLLSQRAISVVDEGLTPAKAGKGASGREGKQPKSDVSLPPLTAEGVVGGVLSVLHSRLIDDPPGASGKSTGSSHQGSLIDLTGPLMSLIVLPYLGPAAARRELARPAPQVSGRPVAVVSDPLRDLGIRLTYRTVRVLLAVASQPGGSNRQVADESGIGDQGQISKLLARLHGLGLIENTGAPSLRGAPNAWVLTDKGWEVQGALSRNGV